jgi:putative tryptophan/tyrosine transport system substrate-binding protein
MRRRDFIFGSLAIAAMGSARAEQRGKVYRIAIVHPSYPVASLTETSFSPGIRAIFTELRRLGYIEGKNLVIERYSGEGRAAHYPDLAREVVAHNPDLITTIGDDLVLDFKATTTIIPIVGVFLAPIENGIVSSLARPGGNITGITAQIGLEVWGKRIQLLRQVVPQISKLGAIESTAIRDRWQAVEREDAQRTGITWVGPTLNHPIDETEYRRVFAALVEDRADAIVVTQELENITNRKLIAELAEKNRLPAIYALKVFVEAGGLMSYGSDQSQYGLSTAYIADQILKGAKPGDIPIMQPTKFELVINLKAAKVLGLTVPPELLATADEVIE